MRVIGSNTYGGPEVLELIEVPDPVPGQGEVLVRVHAAAVNPTDLFVVNGDRAEIQEKQSRPLVPGMDVAGVIEAIGPDTETDLAVGDRVMAVVAPNGSHGAYSELLALSADSVVRAPEGSSFAEASTLPMNGMTARQALDILDLSPGQVIAVSGAAGAFGGYVVQWAKADGLTVVADASEKDRELVSSLGADVVLDRGDDFPARVREAFPDGVDGAADGALLDGLFTPALKDGASVATVRWYDQPGERGVQYKPVSVRDYLHAKDKLDELRRLVEEGAITARVAATFPPEEAAEAQRRLAAGGVRGRHVIVFD